MQYAGRWSCLRGGCGRWPNIGRLATVISTSIRSVNETKCLAAVLILLIVIKLEAGVSVSGHVSHARRLT
jgi:hypothetical protein